MPENYNDSIAIQLERIIQTLPDGLFFFEIDGQTIFPVYGNDGGISTHSSSYLIRRGIGEFEEPYEMPIDGASEKPGGWRFFGFRWNELTKPEDITTQVAEAIKEIA